MNFLLEKYLISILLFSICNFCNGQKESDFGFKGFDLIAGYQYQNFHTVEFGVGYGFRGEEMAAMGYGNLHVTGEMVFRNQEKNIYGFKSGFSLALAFFDCAGHFSYYLDFNGKSNYILRPEIGLSYIGIIDINIGKNFVLNKQTDLGLNSFVFIFRITLGQTTKPLYDYL